MSQTYSKTALGTQEMATRTLNLAPGLRNALILVDKSRPLEKLQRDAQRIGSPDDFIEQLLALGLIVANQNDAATPTDEKPAISVPVPQQSTLTKATAEIDLRGAQRQLVKLIEKTLGPGGERFAVAVESTKTLDVFMVEAAKIKTVLVSVNAKVAQDPLWAIIGL